MPVNTYELVKAISVVTDNANIRVSVKKSAKGAVVCGVICFAGGLLLGPVGLAVGGTVGGLTAYKMNKDNANVRVSVKNSIKGAIICGLICCFGGLLLGPIGLAIGGMVGGLMAYKLTRGSFVPVGQILMNELTEEQTEKLIRHVNAAVADVGPADIALLIPLLASQVDIQAKVLQAVTSFLVNEMRMSIVD